MSTITVVEADLHRPDHQEAILRLVNNYARDPMGNSQDLPQDVCTRLIPGLQAHPTTLIFLAYRGDEAVGIAVCFRGFSTFAAKPLINIHDLAVNPDCRGQGIGRLLLQRVEHTARELGCCKLTLEVQLNNTVAQGLYFGVGFIRATYDPEAGQVLFLQKPL